MDGRVQIPVIHWIKQQFKVEYVDMITEPGMDGLVADQQYSLEKLIQKIKISLEKNKASLICVAGHHDCKGNPGSESAHREQILLSVERLKKEFLNTEIIGIWINEKWQGERISEIN